MQIVKTITRGNQRFAIHDGIAYDVSDISEAESGFHSHVLTLFGYCLAEIEAWDEGVVFKPLTRYAPCVINGRKKGGMIFFSRKNRWLYESELELSDKQIREKIMDEMDMI